MKLYHYSKSRSTRVLWLLEELGLEYELEALPFDARAFELADHFEIASYGELPVLVDDGHTMTESLAVVHYLLNRYADGHLEPDRDSDLYGPFLEWIEFGESKLMDPLTQLIQHTALLPEHERDPKVAAQSRRVLHHFARTIDAALAGKRYLLGEEFTAADVVIGYSLFLAADFGALPKGLGSLSEYYERLSERPAFKLATRS